MSRSLIDPTPDGVNAPEYSVSELAGVLKRRIEGEFDHIRVRGELGRVSRPASGHVYLDLKDDRAVLAAVIWKGTAISPKPEEGMEVIATGRLTTFPGQSKYQMIIESLAPAGVGALMAMLEKRRAALAAEGLFDAGRKRGLPFLPLVIGVVTSPTGAVIQDILHRLADRFPVHVLVWPVVVQGERCAAEVAAAITGFSRLSPGGPVPRPDVLIVARGGGSVEDLWGFNDEGVVRAAATCTIPLISAVGHETDTTLIDHAADRRAPTPSAAAEMAVPVRAELLAQVADLHGRLTRIGAREGERRGQRLADLARALPRPQALVADRRQRLDVALARLARHADPVAAPAARLAAAAAGLPRAGALLDPLRLALSRLGARLPWPGALLKPGRQALSDCIARLPRPQGRIDGAELRLARVALPVPSVRLAREAAGVERATRRLRPALERAIAAARLAASGPGARLRPALVAAPLAQGATRLTITTAALGMAGRRGIPTARDRLATGARPLVPAITRGLRTQADRLRALARMLGGLGPAQTLARGFVMVRDGTGAVLTRADQATPGSAVHLTFADATLSATLDPAGRMAPPDPGGLSPPIPSPSPKGGREAPRREGGARGSRAKPPAGSQGSLF